MWCLTSTETTRLFRDGEKGHMEEGEEVDYILYTYRYTVTTRMTPALRWAATRAFFFLFINCEGRQSHKTVSTDHNFWRERRSEAGLNQGPSAYQPNALPPDQTGSPVHRNHILFITVLGTRGRGGAAGIGCIYIYIYIWIAHPCALTCKDLRLRTSATTWRINVKEVGTPPVWSNCVATTGSISTAVWNGDRV